MSSDTVQKIATRRYYARILDERVVFDDEWSSDLFKNAIAIALGCIIATFIVQTANSSIEYILLNNFPRISRDWCLATKGLKQSRLRRVQNVVQYAFCLVVLAMRWPGWKLLHLHLWQCILYTIAAYAVVESAMVMALAVVQAYLWIGNYLAWWTGWDPLRANEKREEFMRDARLDPPTELFRRCGAAVREALEPIFVLQTALFVDADVISTGSRTATSQDFGYARVGCRGLSFEEARLQYYEKQQTAPPSPSPLSLPRTSPDDSAVAKDGIEDSSAEVIGSNSGIFPEWMRGRSFRDSIFGSSLSSSQSRNSPCPLPEEIAISTIAKVAGAKNVSKFGTDVPDLLTGSPIRSRKFL